MALVRLSKLQLHDLRNDGQGTCMKGISLFVASIILKSQIWRTDSSPRDDQDVGL